MNGNSKNAIKNRIVKAKGKPLALLDMLGPKGKLAGKSADQMVRENRLPR